MKLHELPLGVVKAGDQIYARGTEAVEGMTSKKVNLDNLIDYIGSNEEFVTALTRSEFFQNHLEKELLRLLAYAGLDTVAQTNLAADGGFVSNNGYIAPGQQLKDPEAEIELTGTVKVD